MKANLATLNILSLHRNTLATAIKNIKMAANISLLSLGAMNSAQANPTGGAVAAGNATIASHGATLDINQSSQRAIINWQSFSVGQGEKVNFNQPNSSSATLNRVVGNDPSTILGQINANGNVTLVNQNGIMISKTAEVNVGSLVATTANITNNDFMAAKMNFTEFGANPQARVINNGQITVQQGGLVALMAPGVENNGVINAHLGKVVLASGDGFTLDLYGDQLINLTVNPQQLSQFTDASGQPLSHYVSNTGEIIADGGNVTITAATGKSIIDSLINVQGTIQAQTVENHNGVITLLGDESTLVNVSGVLDASGKATGTSGGTVDIRGAQVTLADGAQINVSGNVNGGTALIGGDYQGSGNGLNATDTVVSSNASINADSLSTGNGGKVIVWAEDHTEFDGTITARGGQQSGNGGLVKVSGKNTLSFNGNVDASAKHGSAGTLLLDPGNLTIVDQNVTMPNASLPGSGSLTNNSTTQDDFISVQRIDQLLQTGTNVNLQANNNLTVNALIDGRGGFTGAGLSLTAGSNIDINNSIYTNGGGLSFTAGSNVNINNSIYTNGGSLSNTAGSNVNINNSIYTNGGSLSNTAGSSVNIHNSIYTNNGSITAITRANGSIFLSPSIFLNAGSGLISLFSAQSIYGNYSQLISTGPPKKIRLAYGNHTQTTTDSPLTSIDISSINPTGNPSNIANYSNSSISNYSNLFGNSFSYKKQLIDKDSGAIPLNKIESYIILGESIPRVADLGLFSPETGAVKTILDDLLQVK